MFLTEEEHLWLIVLSFNLWGIKCSIFSHCSCYICRAALSFKVPQLALTSDELSASYSSVYGKKKNVQPTLKKQDEIVFSGLFSATFIVLSLFWMSTTSKGEAGARTERTFTKKHSFLLIELLNEENIAVHSYSQPSLWVWVHISRLASFRNQWLGVLVLLKIDLFAVVILFRLRNHPTILFF